MLVSITAVEQIQRWGPVDPFPKANADCKNLYHFGWRPRIFVLVSSKEKEWSQTRKVLIKQMRMTCSWKKVSQPSFGPCHTSCPLRKKSQNNIPEMLMKMFKIDEFSLQKWWNLKTEIWRHEGCVWRVRRYTLRTTLRRSPNNLDHLDLMHKASKTTSLSFLSLRVEQPQ